MSYPLNEFTANARINTTLRVPLYIQERAREYASEHGCSKNAAMCILMRMGIDALDAAKPANPGVSLTQNGTTY